MATTTGTDGVVSTPADDPEDTTPQPRLDKLPEELVSNIAQRLDYDDITSLRLACRNLEARSFHDFATEYFSAKGFMLSTESLKVLGAIASDKRLRGYLRSIYIVTAWFSESAFSCPNGCDCAWKPTARQAEAYRIYIDDQKHLKKCGEDKQMLIDAFKQLPNVTSLHLADHPHHGEDIEDANTYGLRKVIRRSSRPPSYSPTLDKKNADYARWCTHVWKLMCQAVSESGMTTLTHFGAYMNKTPDGLSVSQDFKLGPKTIAGMTKALQSLKSLRLTIRGNSLIKRGSTTDVQASTAMINKFAGVLRQPGLEDVAISYDMTASSGLVHSSLMKRLDLSKIKKLSIDGVFVSASSLVTTLNGLTSVADLQLSWSNLTKGNWVPVLQAIQKLTLLEHLHLMWLQEAGRKCYFLSQREHDPEEDWLDDGEAGFDADAEESDDDEMPDLEPAPGVEPLSAAVEALTMDPTPTPASEAEDFTAPGYENQLERGYFICLKGTEQLAKYLPIFVKEYNLGESLDDHVHLPPIPALVGGAGGAAGPGGPAAFQVIMNSIFGGPPPPAGGPGGQGGHGAHAGHGAHGAHAGAPGAGAQAAHHDAAPVHGPPPPPGFITLGGGPGYQMMMGTGPLPPVLGGNGATGGAGGHQAAPHGSITGNANAAPPQYLDPADLFGDDDSSAGTVSEAGMSIDGGVAADHHAHAGAANDLAAYYETEEESGGFSSDEEGDADEGAEDVD